MISIITLSAMIGSISTCITSMKYKHFLSPHLTNTCQTYNFCPIWLACSDILSCFNLHFFDSWGWQSCHCLFSPLWLAWFTPLLILKNQIVFPCWFIRSLYYKLEICVGNIVRTSYPWVLHLWIQPTMDWKYLGGENPESSQKQNLNLLVPATIYIASTLY